METKLQTKRNRALIVIFFIIIGFFLLFCGGALSVTMSDGGMMGGMVLNANGEMTRNAWRSGISWMWIPALFFLSLSFSLGWLIFIKKKI